jgi:hypothetical protein
MFVCEPGTSAASWGCRRACLRRARRQLSVALEGRVLEIPALMRLSALLTQHHCVFL